jgi:hypothetical protein
MLIKVKVFPESKEEDIIKKSENSFEVRVKEKPERGLANMAVISLLAYYFEIPRGKIRMIKGFRERNKIFDIAVK